MGMKDFHCETFELSFRFTSEEIELDKFLKAVGIEDREEAADEDGEIFIRNTFGRQDQTTDYHGHVRIVIDKEDSGRVTFRYHADGLDIENEEPPHAEDFANWFADFFKKEEFKPRLNASYTFDNSYAPTITLPFPVAASEKALSGSSVIGVSIQLPKKHLFDMAIVQLIGDETVLSVLYKSEIRLKDFKLLTELERLETHLDSLIRRQEPSDETGSAQQEE
jgi:hypothetical protein